MPCLALGLFACFVLSALGARDEFGDSLEVDESFLGNPDDSLLGNPDDSLLGNPDDSLLGNPIHLHNPSLLDMSVATAGEGADSLGVGLAVNTSGSISWSSTILDGALNRAFGDVLVMQHVRYTFANTLMTPEPAEGTKKVAYLFMTKDSLDQHDLWQAWFKAASPDTYSIYIHQYKYDSEEAAHQRELWGPLGAQFIPVVKTGWGQLSGVEYALFWEAMRDPLNAQFVLLSEGHVPLKSAGYVYDYLMTNSSESKVCFNAPQTSLSIKSSEVQRKCMYKDTLKYVKLGTRVMGGSKQELAGRVRKHHQWLVLARTHVVDVLKFGEEAMRQHLRATYRAPIDSGMDPAMLGASDESFVATALLLASAARGNAREDEDSELESAGILSSCTTFVYWRHCWKKTALGAGAGWGSTKWGEMKAIAAAGLKTDMSDWFDARKSPAKVLNDSPRNFGATGDTPSDKYLVGLVNAGFLFARKFGKDEKGVLSFDLSNRLPALWQTWETNFGDHTRQKMDEEVRMWPVLDVDDPKVKQAAQLRIPKIREKSRWALW